MAEFQLYRLRILKSELFTPTMTRSDLLRRAIQEKPTMSPDTANKLRNNKWHIGNVLSIDNDVFAFALGRQAPSNASKYDEKTRNFYSSEDDEAPFSLLILDVALGLVAIMVKPDVGTTDIIARRLINLIQLTDSFESSLFMEVSIGPIYDSNIFINMLRDAFQIKRFVFEFFPPNPDDAEVDIQAPTEEYAQKANASHGKISIEGTSLKLSVIDPVARGVISTGAEAVAVIRERRNSNKTRRISSKTQRVATEVDKVSLDSIDTLRGAYQAIREVYASNRGDFDEA